MKFKAWPAPRLRYALIGATGFLILDGWCGYLTGLHSTAVSYFFQIPAPLAALAACAWRARHTKGRARGLWTLLMTGLVLYSMAVLMSAWEQYVEHLPFNAPSLADFAYFFYGVPILFALSTPVEGERLPLFSWLDAVQAFFAGYLAYVVIFSTSPFFDSEIRPISGSLLAYTYNVENIALAVGCAVRLLASPKCEENRFFRTLLVYLAAYAAAVAYYNQILMNQGAKIPWTIALDAPFVILGLLVIALPSEQSDDGHSHRQQSRLALFIDNGSPIFFTIALLALGLVTLSHHFYTGVLAIGVGLIAYGTRTTVLQMRYLRSQQELRAAHDRLAEISLQDSLTGIANRRRFDQTLDSEWHRAMRTHSALSLLLVDLDYFKKLNDTYGHRHGDRCLTRVAAALHSVASRSGDLIARYGGEEFGAILPVTNLEAAKAIASRMQLAVAALKITNPSEIGNYLTISVGICSCEAPTCGSPEGFIEAADRALYRAKDFGRNRVDFEPLPEQRDEPKPPAEAQGALFPVHESQCGEHG